MNWSNWDSNTVAAWVAAIAAAFFPLVNGAFYLWRWFRQGRTNRFLEKQVGSNLYPSSVLDQSTRYYVESYCSMIDPAREEEIMNVRAHKRKVFDAIDDFFEKESVYRHMIILADSGMGKTSVLINYFVRNYARRKPYKIKLLPLGIPDLKELIEEVPDKENTTIFLDAFDEDTKAIADHKKRLEELMNSCRRFNRVVITCRTQFFLDDEEVNNIQPGILRVGPRSAGEEALYTFQKLYLMPLTDQQVAKYLRKRYPLWQWMKRRQARKAVEKIPLLSVRPMLLTHIPDLLEQNITIRYSYELYETMINAWLQREEGWIDPEKLRKFSERLAVDLYVNREFRGAERLPRNELSNLMGQWGVPLDVQQISGRSLLNRDADGNLKFAHRSIMEYLFLRCDVSSLSQDWSNVQLTVQMKNYIQEAIDNQNLAIFRNLPHSELAGDFTDADLTNVCLVGAKFHGGFLKNANLERANLKEATLRRAILIKARFEQANLVRANLTRANLAEADLEEVDLTEAFLLMANLEGAYLVNANLKRANLVRAYLIYADLKGANLEAAKLINANLREANLTGTNLKLARYNNETIWPVGFDYQNSGAIGPYVNLEGADLEKANLARANLTGANLARANLTRANLVLANLKGANLEGSTLAEADLSRAKYDNKTIWPVGFDPKSIDTP